MKTGFSRLCITPPLGTCITGYYEERFTKGVLDDLYVSAVAFEQDGERALVIAADLLKINQVDCDEYRKRISERCDIDFDNIFITCSHTHTGPVVGVNFSTGLSGDGYYEEFLARQLCDVSEYALCDLADSEFYYATGEAKNISFVRRFRMKDGSVQTNPGINNENVDSVLATPNEQVKLIKIVRDGAEDIFLVNFGVHPDVIGGELISADYIGFVRDTIEAAVEDTYCVFLQGAQGDVNHINPFPTESESQDLEITFDGCPRGYGHARHMGRVIAGAVLSVCDKAKKIENGSIRGVKKTVKIPSNQQNDKLDYAKKIVALHESGKDSEIPFEAMELTTVVAEATRIVNLENGPDSYSFTISALKIGDFVLAGIPGEPFTEIGERICDASPFDNTVFCALANGGESYFPTSKAYDEGGYESRSSTLKKGGDNILVESMTSLLESIK